MLAGSANPKKITAMSKVEILAELPKLKSEELAKTALAPRP
jgi:hypothetical protein